MPQPQLPLIFDRRWSVFAPLLSQLHMGNSALARYVRSVPLAPSLFAIILLIAVALKAEAAGSLVGTGRTISWFLLGRWAEIALEVAVAVWLLSGFGDRWARRAAIALLAAFLAVGLARLTGGGTDCGCFGRLSVPPVWTVAFDGALLALIVRSQAIPQFHPSTSRACWAIIVATTVPALVLAARARTPSFGRDQIIIVDPSSSRNQPLGLIAALDSVSQGALAHGQWTLVLFDRRCGACAEFLRTPHSALVAAHDRVLAVDIAPADSLASSSDFRVPFRRAVLGRGIRCVMEVPALIDLDGGVVKAIAFPAHDTSDSGRAVSTLTQLSEMRRD